MEKAEGASPGSSLKLQENRKYRQFKNTDPREIAEAISEMDDFEELPTPSKVKDTLEPPNDRNDASETEEEEEEGSAAYPIVGGALGKKKGTEAGGKNPKKKGKASSAAGAKKK
jgi:hypothetical protein